MWSPGVEMGREDAVDRLLHDRVALVEVDEAARDDLRAADDRARLLVDGDDDHEHAVGGERAAVPQDDVADLADGEAVDKDITGGDRAAAPRGAIGVELDRRAVLDDVDVLGRPRRSRWRDARAGPACGTRRASG